MWQRKQVREYHKSGKKKIQIGIKNSTDEVFGFCEKKILYYADETSRPFE
jgi:hypothetical protein